jgi:hypothetical protein
MSMFTSFATTHGEKFKSLFIGACIAGIGSGITYVLQDTAGMEFGDKAVFVGAGISVIANFLRKFGIPIAAIVFGGKQL